MRLIALLGLTAGLMLTAGCATYTKSSEEVVSDFKNSVKSDMLQLSHDWNKFWLVDREIRLHEWYTR